MNWLYKFYLAVCKLRVFETHIGLLFIHVFSKVLCDYKVTNYLFSFSIDIRHLPGQKGVFKVFDIDFTHKVFRANKYMPLIGVSLEVMNIKLIDNTKKGYAILRIESDKSSREWQANQERDKKIAQTAPKILQRAIETCNTDDDHWRTDAVRLLKETESSDLATSPTGRLK